MAVDEKKDGGSPRVSVTLAHGIYETLRETAEREGRPVGNLAASILELWVRQENEKALYSPKDLVETLLIELQKLHSSSKNLERSERWEDDSSKLAHVIQELDFSPVLWSDQAVKDEILHGSPAWAMPEPYDLRGGFQERKFLMTLLQAGKYAPVVIPEIFRQLGAMPPNDSRVRGTDASAYNDSVNAVDIYTKIVRSLKGSGPFAGDVVAKCVDVIENSIQFVSLRDYPAELHLF